MIEYSTNPGPNRRPTGRTAREIAMAARQARDNSRRPAPATRTSRTGSRWTPSPSEVASIRADWQRRLAAIERLPAGPVRRARLVALNTELDAFTALTA